MNNPPSKGERVKVFNQMTETHRVGDLAKLIQKMTDCDIINVPNPRNEAASNDLVVKNDNFLALGLNPISLEEGLLDEVVEVAKKYAYRIDRSRIAATSAWTKDIAKTVVKDPEGKGLKEVG